MTKIALLTTLMDMPRQYGLVPLIENQLEMLSELHNDLPIGFFIIEGCENHDDFEDLPENIKLEPKVPFLHLYDYQPGTKKQTHDIRAEGVHREGGNITNFDKQVDLLVEKLEPELTQYDVVITHDIMFQSWFLVHNAAIRKIGIHHPEIKWIHWLHSGPSVWGQKMKGIHRMRSSGMPNSVFISPNETMVPAFAKMYDVPRKDVGVVYHVVDSLNWLGISKEAQEFIDYHDLIKGDVVCVWPTRLDHLAGKGVKMAVNFMAKMNKLCNAKLVFLNSWGDSLQSKRNIREIKDFAKSKSFPKENLIFSSEYKLEWKNGVPSQIVRDLYLIGNLFILPSQSETFSFATAEAALTKNLLLLNGQLQVFRELNGDRAEYLEAPSEWGGERIDITYDAGIDAYCMGRAEEILQYLQNCKPLMQQRYVLQHFNKEWIWNNQLRPIIEKLTGGEK